MRQFRTASGRARRAQLDLHDLQALAAAIALSSLAGKGAQRCDSRSPLEKQRKEVLGASLLGVLGVW
jgi:hypothetical protein